jgi:hypothetical protein
VPAPDAGKGSRCPITELRLQVRQLEDRLVVRQLWNSHLRNGDYIRYFLNCGMNCLALGRLGNDFEERKETLKNGETKTKLVKVGTKFKAGGGESFGYEPHLLLELSLERKNRKVNGQEREGEGRMVHRADVLKDRTWALNGRTFRWLDRAKYETGGFRHVWESIRPHFEEVQATMRRVTILAGNSQSLISDSGDSEFYRQRQRKEAISAEIKASLDLHFAGRGNDAGLCRAICNCACNIPLTKGSLASPASDRVTAGKPPDDIVKEPAVPTRNVALFTLVIAGTWFTVMVNVWGVATPEVLLAFRPMASERLFQRKVAHYAQAHPRRVAIRIRNRPSPT